jgi:DNA-binding response OmpR family regulator
LRRSSAKEGASSNVLVQGPLSLDVERHVVMVRGQVVDLTATEFAVLHVLLERPGRLLTRLQLIERAYVHDNHITERTMDTHIRRIRSKMRPFALDPIETVHGLGYKARELA